MNPLAWIAKLFTGGVVDAFAAPLSRAWNDYLQAETNEKRIEADLRIKSIEASRDLALIEARDRWSATRVGRWLIVVPFGLHWAAIYAVNIINPWFGTSLVVVKVPDHIHSMALILVPAIVLADGGQQVASQIMNMKKRLRS
jgi:hypothetical protein